MTLTYKQEPKKYNPTIRLKRIAQRFDTGYRNIRRFKEDISNHLTTRVATKRIVNLPVKPIKVSENRTLYPSKKWNVLLKQAQSYGKTINSVNNQHHASIVFRRFFGYTFKKAINVEYRPQNIFFSTDGDQQIPIVQKKKNHYSNILSIAIRSFTLPYDLIVNKKHLINNIVIKRNIQFQIINKQIKLLNNLMQIILQRKYVKLHKITKKISQISYENKKKLAGKIELVKRKLLQSTLLLSRKINHITLCRQKKSIKEVLTFKYGKLSRKLPNKLMKNDQGNLVFEQLYQQLPINQLNLGKKNLVSFQSKPNILIQKKPCSIIPMNVFNFTTRSHGVLYRFMMILREKFGIRKYDIPFRIDTYLTAYEKRPRPTVFKTMCLARGKIRLFYGQLTQRKTARLIKQTKAGFRGMFGIMERRLDVLLVRTNFCKNIFTAQHLVRHGHILVNFKLMTNCFYSIKMYDVVTFREREMEKLYKYMIFLKLKLNRFKFPMVSYLVINYEYMYFYVKPIIDARKSVGFTAPISHGFLSKF